MGFDVEAEMAAGVFVFGVEFAFGNFHVVPRQFSAERAGGHLSNALAQDADALLDFLHLDPVSIPAIAERAFHAGADADVEFEFVVDAVRAVATKGKRDAAAANHRAGEGVFDAKVFGADADVGGALDENVIEAEQVVVFVDLGFEVVEEFAQLGEESRRQVPGDAADVDVAEREPCAAELLE